MPAPISIIEQAMQNEDAGLPPQGFWIMLTHTPPVKNPPPRMSVHFVTLWPEPKYVAEQKSRLEQGYLHQGETGKLYDTDLLGLYEGDWENCVRLNFDGRDIRVFPHEYTRWDSTKMHKFIVQEDCYELQITNKTQEVLVKQMRDSELMGIYEAALLDGCTQQQAQCVMMGIHIDDAEIDFPPIGWYRLTPAYREIFEDYAPEPELDRSPNSLHGRRPAHGRSYRPAWRRKFVGRVYTHLVNRRRLQS